jgi:enamine deaminase RidA (YjgF/YER057c/UK114 family)
MNKIYNPSTVAAPGSYSHGIEIPPGARILHISGQLGIDPTGKLRDGTGEQAAQAWSNILNILAAAGMGADNLVKITTFITDPADVEAVRAARSKALGAVKPASTLLIVKGLAAPEYRVEIEAVAAKA